MKKKLALTKLFLILFIASSQCFAQEILPIKYQFDLPGVISETIGRGICETKGDILYSKDKYPLFGNSDWRDYEFEFDAISVDTVSQIHICAGFRATDRDDRYIVGLKGGIQNELYLERAGYMGADDYISLKPVDFNIEKNKWYHFKIQVEGNRTRVFLNNEPLPRIDARDKQPFNIEKGKITLGGTWVKTGFRNLSVKSISNTFDFSEVKEYALPLNNKEKERKQSRSQYKPITIQTLNSDRTEISLNGNWLFSPGYEIDQNEYAVSPDMSDRSWHIMHVPDFWNPKHIWLYGEKYNTASKGVSDNYYQKEADRCSQYTFDYKKTNIGWYRQWMVLPENIKGRETAISFDAVSKVAEVWINGQKAGAHIGMFGAFQINATPYIKAGLNLITVKVLRDYITNIQDGDKIADVAVTVEITQKMIKDLAHGFYNDDPAGIWQPVKLIITNPVKMEDVFIKPNLTGAIVDISLTNNTSFKKTLGISTTINKENSNDYLFNGLPLNNIPVAAGETKTISFSISDLKPLLWSPQDPNLYKFSFKLLDSSDNKTLDSKTILSGFRTFEVKGDYFYLNGRPFWLRGSDHTPMSLEPNDTLLANKYCQLLRKGNVNATRTHTAPYTETWMEASDRNGIGVSYEGGWPWLMINGTMPDKKLIELWKNEYLDLLKKYRNHPSLLFWTVNNEMKFYDNDPDFERAKLKMKIISDVVKQMRETDPSRPVCFDSNYGRDTKKFGKEFFNTIDDGDIDDKHWYINWYHGSLFEEFNGEFQKKFKNEGRPLISQEMSSGYPDETGHPTRFYAMVHQTSSALIGNYSYDFCNPDYFLNTHAFITKELAEALRRTNDRSAGIMHFAGLTWFSNVFSSAKIEPHPTYFAMQKALQPVLVSAEIWGRHFYAGEKLPIQIYIVNDQENGEDLNNVHLDWKIVTSDGLSLVKGSELIASVKYYSRYKTIPTINIPDQLPQEKVNVKLILTLTKNNRQISENEYDLLLATRKWTQIKVAPDRKIVLFDYDGKIKPILNSNKVDFTEFTSVSNALKEKASLYIFAGINNRNTSEIELKQIRSCVDQGGKVLLLNAGTSAVSIYPEYIRGFLSEKGEILSMEIPESNLFNAIEPLETRYFNNNQRESPAVCNGAYQINRNPAVMALASFTKVHGYLQGNMTERRNQLDKIKGFPILQIQNNGNIILSEVLLDKSNTDPVAGKLLSNMIKELLR